MEILTNDYLNDLKKIKETIRNNQNKAIVIVNSAMIMTYYEIGTIINKRKTWGSKYIQKLSEDLKEYGGGYSFENLRKMAQFSLAFTKDEIWLQPVTKIPWGTLVTVILSKSKSHDEMLWYINETYKNGWSRSTVLKQFEAKAYERNLIEPKTTPSIKDDDRIEGLFKDTYVFKFLDKESTKKEIDLKIGEFEASDLGQLILYVGAINKLEKTIGDNDTIGLLLCKDADNFIVKTTLDMINGKIGISKYKVLEDLPNYLLQKLKEI